MKKSSKSTFLIIDLVVWIIGLAFQIVVFIFKLIFGKSSSSIKRRKHLDSSGSSVVEIHGESFYQDSFIALFGEPDRDGHNIETHAKLVREPLNPHDSNAIKCLIQGRLVGHVNRDDAEQISKNMDKESCKEMNVQCFVRGGWKRGSNNSGMYGAEVTVSNSYLA